MYYVTGIQHTKTGDIVMPVLGYETRDAAKRKVNEEWNYAYDTANFIGVTIIVFDNAGIVDNELSCNYVKVVPVQQPTQPAGE